MNSEESLKQTKKNNYVSVKDSDFRVEYWTEQEVKELVQDLDIASKFERNSYE